jgi:hypothetical protein
MHLKAAHGPGIHMVLILPLAQGCSVLLCLCRCVLWLGAPPEDKMPKDAAGASSRHYH